MNFLKLKIMSLLIFFSLTFSSLGMNTYRLPQKQRQISQLNRQRQQKQSAQYKPQQESMYDVDTPRYTVNQSQFKTKTEIKQPTFFSKLSDWWYGTSKSIQIGTTEKRKAILTSKELDGDTTKVINKITSLIAQDNDQEITRKITVIIKRKLINDAMYTDNFCQTLSLLISRNLPYDQQKYTSLDEIMNITQASRIFKQLMNFIDRNKIPTTGFYLLKQLNAPIRKNLKQIQLKQNIE